MNKLIIIIIGIFFIGVNINIFLDCERVQNKDVEIKGINGGRSIHAPVRINNDADLLTNDCISNPLAIGNQYDPYFIDFLEINGSGFGYCLYIANTTKYIRIENCTFYNINGSGENNGIYLINLVNINISNNIINNSEGAGVYLNYVNYSSIYNNKINNCWYNICSYWSGNISIFKNYINDSGQYGIYLNHNYGNITINGNLFSDNFNGWTIEVYASSYIIIDNNIFKNNNFAIDMSGGGGIYNQVINNYIYNCSQEGIDGSGQYYVIKNNYLENCSYAAIRLVSNDFAYGVIESNFCIKSGRGIDLMVSSNNRINNNTIMNCTYGIYINCFNNEIINNSIINCSNVGILFTSVWAFGNNISHNNFILNNGTNNIYDQNHVQVFDNNGLNHWYFSPPMGGNYWSDRDIPDNDFDGFVDLPYRISLNLNIWDNYPLAFQLPILISEYNFSLIIIVLLILFIIFELKKVKKW